MRKNLFKEMSSKRNPSRVYSDFMSLGMVKRDGLLSRASNIRNNLEALGQSLIPIFFHVASISFLG